MDYLLNKKRQKIGLPPGSVIHIGDIQKDEVSIELIEYNRKEYKEKSIKTGEILMGDNETTTTWINVNGVSQEPILHKIGANFNIHPLILEDIANTEQRPKIDIFGDNIFIILKMMTFNEKKKEVDYEQVSLLLSDNYLITFQERKGDVFDTIRKRLKYNKGIIREQNASYLAYALIDTIIDNYYLTLNMVEEEIEKLEQHLLEKPGTETLDKIQQYRNEIVYIRKTIWPLRGMVRSLINVKSELIDNSLELYLGDVYDHIVEILDMVEVYRDLINNALDIYLNSVNNKMNEIMKVLTLIATIFIPLTFIAGVYGMNFKYMPELKYKFGYPIVIGIMLLITIILLIYFKKKKWF